MRAARSLFFPALVVPVWSRPCIGWKLFLNVYKRLNYGPVIKKPNQAPPRSLSFSLALSVSTLVFCMQAWRAANHPASSSCTAQTQTFAKLRVERTITACTVEMNKVHALLSLLTAQNRLAGKRPRGATRRQCSQSECVYGRAMWHEALDADSQVEVMQHCFVRDCVFQLNI